MKKRRANRNIMEKEFDKEEFYQIKNLPIDKFDKLAKSQSRLYPDLLKITTEKGIIDDFYEYYGRKPSNDSLSFPIQNKKPEHISTPRPFRD
jgi:hypothetical protein